MLNLPPNASELEIQEEIIYVQALIDSLDEQSDDYLSQKAEFEDDLQELGNMLDRLNDPENHNVTQSAAPNLASGSKRGLDVDDVSDERANKRHTPSPLPYGNTSSATDRSRAQEDRMRRQYAQMKADEAYARSLEESTSSAYGMAGPSSQNAYQSTLTSDGSLRPPVRPVYERPVLPPPTPNRVKSEYQPLPHRPHSMTTAETVDLTGDSDDERVSMASHRPVVQPHGVVPSHVSTTRTFGNTPQYQASTRLPSMNQHPAMPGSYPGANRQHSAYGHPMTHAGPSASLHPYSQRTTNGYVYNLPSGSSTLTQNLYTAGLNAMNSVRQFGQSTDLSQLSNLINGNRSRPYDTMFADDDDELTYTGTRIRESAMANPYAGHEDLYRSRYEQLEAYNPEKTTEELNALLKNIRPDEDLPDHLLIATPPALSIRLHKYQELGLTWLKSGETPDEKDNCRYGGILADDMGLGKTIQMLSLIVEHKSDNARCKTTLIVAPVALLRQWKQEIRDKLKPAHALTVFIHHATSKVKSWRDLMQYDVVLTTYGSLAAELKKRERFDLRKSHDPQARPRADEQCVLLDPDCKYWRVVLDEAQMIKNKTTLTAKAACHLKATYRWCVTGTPMMNNVTELYSLIKFLRIKPYDSWERFRNNFVMPLKCKQDEPRDKAMQKLQVLCRSIMLRRTKKSEYRGKPILVLPERSTQIEHGIFDEDEQDFYTALETQSQVKFNKFLKAGTVGRSYSAILVLLLRLRQACCHPHLIKDFSIAAAANVTDEELMSIARQLSDNVVTRIKATEGNFECSICMDGTQNPAIFFPCGHDTCRECFLKLADPSNGIQEGHENAVKPRCPHCRADIDPKRITDFISFKRVHMPELLTQEEKAQFGISEADGSETESESEKEDEDNSETESEVEDDTLNGFIVRDNEVDSDDDNEAGNASEAEEASAEEELLGGRSTSKKSKAKKSKKAKGKQKAKAKKTLTLADLKKASQKNKALRKQYLKQLRKDYESSAKLRKMAEILDDIVEGPDLEDNITEGKKPVINTPEKVLIFSQWTSLLDLAEIEIDAKGLDYRRYDGSMNATARNDAVDDFKDTKKNVRVMLVSLKAGNAGLNLNCANHVIILDPFWNPYIEEQAIDRAHRIGQTRPVKVHRVLVENTVEDRIIALQESKRKIIEQALDEQQASHLSRLGVQELSYLFGVTSSMHD